MANLRIVVNALRKERQLAAKQIEQIDAALAALGNPEIKRTAWQERSHDLGCRRRKIAAAQRARWAKLKAKKA